MGTKSILLSAVALGLVVPLTPAGAQEAAATRDSSDIIVTARKRQESVLNVPVVENVISAEALDRTQVVDLQGVTTKVPGLFVAPALNTIGTLISLRGVGTSSLDAGIDQSVSLNIDGQQFSQGLAFQSGLFDLTQAEVLKGPQALFFGKNSPAGVIALRTADPQDFAEIIARASYEFEAREPRAELIVSGPVSDTLGIRIAGSWSDRDGYFRNTAGATAIPALGGLPPAHPRSDSNENYILRATVLWKPTDNFYAKLKLNVTRDKSDAPNNLQMHSCLAGTGPSVIGVPFIGGPGNCTIDNKVAVVDMNPAFFPGIRNQGRPFLNIKQRFGVLELGGNLTDDVLVTSTSTYYRNVTDGLINGTYTAAAGSIYADNAFYRRDFTQELRIESDRADAPLNWMIGGYYQDARMKNDILIGWNLALNPILAAFTAPFVPAVLPAPLTLPAILTQGTHDVSIHSKSVFGQLRWRPASELEIGAGVRWTDESRSNRPTFFGSPVTIPQPRISSKNWSPELSITYTPTDDLTIFGALKQGYKSGSYSITVPNNPGDDNSFGDEKVQGGEAGVKARLLDRTLNVNAAFYYYRFKGLQVGVSQPAGANNVPVTRTLNAGSAETYGIDFDATYRAPWMDGLALNLSANWNKAKFIKLSGVPCYGGQTIALGCNQALNPLTGLFTARDESGTPLERAPEWQVIGGFDYERSVARGLDALFGGSLQYSSSYTSPIGSRPDFRNPGFTKLNAYVTLKDHEDRWEVSLIGNNLTDEVRCGYGANSDFLNTSVLTAFAGVTGGPANPSGKIDEVACMATPGRSVYVKLTLRPLGLLR